MKKMKSILSVILVILIVSISAPLQGLESLNVIAFANNITFAGGDGTVDNPYLITNANQLDAIRYNLNAHYKQINNIDMSSFGNWNPIGNDSSLSGSTGMEELPSVEIQPFSGSFDGCGYSIFNLTINDSSNDFANACYGLFSNITDGLVKNVVLKNINFFIDKSAIDYVDIWNNYGSSYEVLVGGIAGRSNTCIDNCYVSGSINVTHCNDASIGGIVGHGTTNNCINYASIGVLADRDSRYKNDSTVHCGGIVGHTNSVNGTVSTCVNYGDITTIAGDFAYVGGISGEYGKIENCVNFGEIDGKTTAYNSYSSFAGNCNVGGIVGATSSDFTRYSVNYGSIKSSCIYRASSYAGGIVGFCGYYGSGRIYNCVNIGANIDSTTLDKSGTVVVANAGRIAGYSINVEKCASLESTNVNGVVLDSSVDTDNNGQEQTIEQLLQQSTYVGFDFEKTWKIDESIGGAILLITKENVDTDGDGLPDVWEMNGIDTNGDGILELDLKAMGADPNKKDIFVEVDWMVRPEKKFLWWVTKTSHSFKPTESQMRMVYDAFQEHNINLHIDVGPESTDFVTGEKWGDLSEGNEITYTQMLNANISYDTWNSLLDISNARKLVFHHCIFGDYLYNNTNDSTSGSTPGFGQFFAVTLGGWGTVNDLTIAGTFMHELGHSLGLTHGGCDHENYKPNYLSIMNYAFQTTGLVGTGSLNYSDYKLPDIDENHINENNGIDPNGLTAGTNLGTTIFYRTNSEINTGPISKTSIDFNESGNIETNISMDLNPGGNVYNEPISILKSNEDWSNINFKSGVIGSGSTYEDILESEIPTDTNFIKEKTFEESIKTSTLAVAGTTNIEIVSPTIIKDIDGQNLYFDICNLGATETNVTLSVKSILLSLDYQENVVVAGSKNKLEKTRISIPINSNFPIGEYEITCSLSNESTGNINKSFHVNIYSPTSEEIAELSQAIENDTNAEIIDSNVFNEMKNVLDKTTLGKAEYNYSFNIQEPSRNEIRNRDGIILHAKVEGTCPMGSYIEWTASNGNFDNGSNENKLEIIAKNKGWTTFTATLYDVDGNILASDSVEMYSKSGFFDKICGLFRLIFGITKIYES